MKRTHLSLFGSLVAAIASILFPALVHAETIGNPLVPGTASPPVDTAQGAIFVENQGFSIPGSHLLSFGFYDNLPAENGLLVTPIIFHNTGSGFVVSGVGSPVINASTGAQTFAFSLAAGSADVGPGYYFGYKNGTDANPNQTGVIEFSFSGSAVPSESYFGTNLSNDLIPVGTNLGAGTFLGPNINQDYRIYSVQATATPEPSTFVLGGLGAAGLIVAARRRRKA